MSERQTDRQKRRIDTGYSKAFVMKEIFIVAKQKMLKFFLSIAMWIYKRRCFHPLFHEIGSIQVNLGYSQSVLVAPSIGLSVFATYAIDEETDKKRPLIDLPCGGY